MKEPSERVLKSIISITSDKDFIDIKKWIEESLEAKKEELIDNPIENVAGAAFELREISDVFNNAKKLLKDMESLQSRRPGF